MSYTKKQWKGETYSDKIHTIFKNLKNMLHEWALEWAGQLIHIPEDGGVWKGSNLLCHQDQGQQEVVARSELVVKRVQFSIPFNIYQ